MDIEFSLDLFKIGYVIAFKYDRKNKFNLFNEGIFQRQLWQGFDSEDAAYTHVAISSGGDYLVNVMPPKAKLILLSRKYQGEYIKILKYRGDDFDGHNRYKIGCLYNALASNLRYDWLGVLSFILPNIKQIKGRPFCSEACAESYQIFYPKIFNGMEPEKIMPANFLSDEFDIAWEGYVPKSSKKSFRQALRKSLKGSKQVFAMA